ncbi:polyprenyl synthetase family protein [Candidatus Micrarchaeota archaeon]|nr:polyprenyl synthetase family protein [Candidatus Micrarchaeota archaeon]
MDFYKLAEPQIKKVEERIDSYLEKEENYMYPLLQEYIRRGGKRIRPVLVFLSTGAVGGSMSKSVDPAAFIELFHNFTLVHDDIEDSSQLRRGLPTMHISHGIPIAINAGDALYTLAWNFFFDIKWENPLEAGKLFSKTFKRVVDGQAMELYWYEKKITDITEDDYFKMIAGKTGSLISCSCELGPFLSQNESLRSALADFGMNIGIAFQIQDDVLNLTGKEEKYKKEIGGDITEGKRTLMLTYAVDNLSEKEGSELKKIILSNTREKSGINRAISLITDSGAVGYASKKAQALVNDAKAELEELEDSEYKSALLEVADFFVKREH